MAPFPFIIVFSLSFSHQDRMVWSVFEATNQSVLNIDFFHADIFSAVVPAAIIDAVRTAKIVTATESVAEVDCESSAENACVVETSQSAFCRDGSEGMGGRGLRARQGDVADDLALQHQSVVLKPSPSTQLCHSLPPQSTTGKLCVLVGMHLCGSLSPRLVDLCFGVISIHTNIETIRPEY
jgi:hypothetical protein